MSILNPIVKKIINFGIFTVIIVGLFAIFPNVDMPVQMINALNYALDLLYSWDFLIPADTIIRVITLAIYLEISLATIQGFVFFERMSAWKR